MLKKILYNLFKNQKKNIKKKKKKSKIPKMKYHAHVHDHIITHKSFILKKNKKKTLNYIDQSLLKKMLGTHFQIFLIFSDKI